MDEQFCVKSLDEGDVAFLGSVLESGALLEDEHFHIAEKILLDFASRRQIAKGDLVVLNGLPRHIGQAGDVDVLQDVRTVIALSCTPEVVFERIGTNAGGDRDERCDDNMDAVRRRLDVYRLRTKKLLDHYHRRSVKIITVQIGAAWSVQDMLKAIG